MIEVELASTLSQYGLLGIMMGLLIIAIKYMAKRDEMRDEKITRVVENNTIALTRFVESTKKCEVNKND